MANMRQQYILVIALAVGMCPPTVRAVEDQSTEGATLSPRPVMRKPVHTVVDETYHRTNMITVKFREGLLIRLRDGNLTDTFGLTVSSAMSLAMVLVGAVLLFWFRRLPAISPHAQAWEPPPEDA